MHVNELRKANGVPSDNEAPNPKKSKKKTSQPLGASGDSHDDVVDGIPDWILELYCKNKKEVHFFICRFYFSFYVLFWKKLKLKKTYTKKQLKYFSMPMQTQ